MGWDDVSKKAGELVTDIFSGAGQAFKGNNPILHSNKAIGHFTGAAEYVGRGLNGGGFGMQNVVRTFANNADEVLDASGKIIKGKNVNWNAKKIAGSAVGAYGVARVATGGGVYKDGQGNTDIIGIPFV